MLIALGRTCDSRGLGGGGGRNVQLNYFVLSSYGYDVGFSLSYNYFL